MLWKQIIRSNIKHLKSILLHFHCASALASFALIAGAAFADEVTTGETHKIDTTTSVIANVETTADLVKQRVLKQHLLLKVQQVLQS